ncbi:MAG: SigE family RNA polymerase sigma factor [Acidimicrobiia bacterium]|nr:SigE family RNA polymerase sigma factor [Acidimicrobiia bacterium]
MAGRTLDSEFDDRFDQLFGVAYRAAYRLCGRRHEAEDIAQEVLARCFARWRRVAPYAEAWVYRSASNLAIDRWRRKESPAEVRERSSGDQLTPVEVRGDLVEALRGLSRRQRDVVVLRYLMDRPEKEVAEVLGCSLGTVKRHAYRGLEALRAALGDNYLGSSPSWSDSPPGAGSAKEVTDDV